MYDVAGVVSGIVVVGKFGVIVVGWSELVVAIVVVVVAVAFDVAVVAEMAVGALLLLLER